MIRMHPGQILKNTIEDMGITSKELAERYDCNESFISNILRGNRNISKKVANKLETILGIPAKFWLNLVTDYEITRDKIVDEIDNNKLNEIIIKYSYNELKKRNEVHQVSSIKDKLMELLQFFSVDNISDIPLLPECATFRKSISSPDKEGKIISWIRMVELESYEIQTGKYDEKKFKIVVQDIRNNIRFIDFDKSIVRKYLGEKLAECGVKYVLVDKIPGTGIWGYVYRDEDNIVLAQTDHYKTNDQFWFTFFHEVAHILYDLQDENRHLDNEDNEDNEVEKKADDYAKNMLIPQDRYEKLISGSKSKVTVINFSNENKLPPGVVVGRLQKEKVIPHSHLNGLKKFFEKDSKNSTS